MILIVGGEGSGKRSFAKTLGVKDNDMADAVNERLPRDFSSGADGFCRSRLRAGYYSSA